MFSLIVTIISIALVAALALATLYYGGTVMSEQRSKAIAAGAKLQSEQILAATQLFHHDQGRYPNDLNELVTMEYLRSVPVLNARTELDLLPVANAASFTWVQAAPGRPVFMLIRSVSEEQCKAVNLKIRGDNGIYNKATPSFGTQCFGEQGPYTVIAMLPEEVVTSSSSWPGGTPTPADIVAELNDIFTNSPNPGAPTSGNPSNPSNPIAAAPDGDGFSVPPTITPTTPGPSGPGPSGGLPWGQPGWGTATPPGPIAVINSTPTCTSSVTPNGSTAVISTACAIANNGLTAMAFRFPTVMNSSSYVADANEFMVSAATEERTVVCNGTLLKGSRWFGGASPDEAYVSGIGWITDSHPEWWQTANWATVAPGGTCTVTTTTVVTPYVSNLMSTEITLEAVMADSDFSDVPASNLGTVIIQY